MRHTFQITVDYSPDDAQLAWLLNHATAGHSPTQARKYMAKRIVEAQIDLHPDMMAITRRNLLITRHR